MAINTKASTSVTPIKEVSWAKDGTGNVMESRLNNGKANPGKKSGGKKEPGMAGAY
jgi:hypothetical protein|tara:strand:- start:1123 stop:1290 length:168 start_codon:yes stop_codon:yes gene_type:complete